MAKGSAGGNVFDWLIGLLLVVVVASQILPIAFASLNIMEADTTNFTAGERGLIGLISILVLIMFVYKIYKGKTS